MNEQAGLLVILSWIAPALGTARVFAHIVDRNDVQLLAHARTSGIELPETVKSRNIASTSG